MSDTFFKNIHISNFKSLKDVTLSDCKRINLLIGKPNVGKSNILEAISLFGLNDNFKLNDFIRINTLSELFFNGNINHNIGVRGNNYLFTASLKKDNGNFSQILDCFEPNGKRKIDANFNTLKSSKILNKFPNVKQYKFLSNLIYDNQVFPELIPPFGKNLFNIIQFFSELRADIASLFSDYDLKLVFDKTSDSLKVMKEVSGGVVFLLPYDSIADTLQRVIFFKTAIASNQNSILLFEEPEAHCFPPYIKHFTQDVLNSETNQFFIATHSPYVLNDFLEYGRDDVAIYMADFKDGQTVVYRLTDDEVNEVYNDGIDVFFNYEKYTQHG